MDYRFAPIERWPTEPTRSKRYSQFKATYKQTLDLLERELEHLRAKNITIKLFLGFGDIRQDGRPYADAKPAQPGVILAFDGKHGHVEMPCDNYTEWRDNLRAIALSLEALRAVDRHGCSKKGEQYKGWTALPAAAGEIATVEAAALFIAGHSSVPKGKIVADSEARDSAYKEAARRLHPDGGGSHEQFVQLQKAVAVLRNGAS